RCGSCLIPPQKYGVVPVPPLLTARKKGLSGYRLYPLLSMKQQRSNYLQMQQHDNVFSPVSTYRVQFNADFTFRHLEEQLDYLQELGITTIYASPVFEAAPGSTHGYDVTDPHTINPAIGTLEEWRALHKKLQDKGISWIQDIVPNHMALHPSNSRLMDVLERGRLSPYYQYFDIDWKHPDP